MCMKIIHKYTCGHEIIQRASCAKSRHSGPCKTLTIKQVDYPDECDDCDGFSGAHICM